MSRSPEHMVTNYKGAEISYSRLFLLSPRPMELRPPPRWDHNTISVSGCPGSWLSQYQGSCQGSEDRMSQRSLCEIKRRENTPVTHLWGYSVIKCWPRNVIAMGQCHQVFVCLLPPETKIEHLSENDLSVVTPRIILWDYIQTFKISI